ncbi:MAG: transcriptional regulator with XRE-family HTH domain [Nonlabens sp.]|jgi:transcriptional regulator with XRE-family HTH domain|uniref:DUF4870 domain-containing protein n=1 Tax=Nonlabens sp. TaxID=1888209 RepID=UPI0039E3580A
MQSVGTKIKEIRLNKGFSQEELATQSQVSLRTIQRIENNENEARGKTLQLICETLEVPIEELLDYGKKEDQQFLMFFHLSVILGVFFVVGNIVLPLILWLTKKDKIIGLHSMGAKLLNFQIWWTILTYAVTIFTIILFFHSGFLGFGTMAIIVVLPLVMSIINVILSIIFAIANRRGKQITYPSIIPMIK